MNPSSQCKENICNERTRVVILHLAPKNPIVRALEEQIVTTSNSGQRCCGMLQPPGLDL